MDDALDDTAVCSTEHGLVPVSLLFSLIDILWCFLFLLRSSFYFLTIFFLFNLIKSFDRFQLTLTGCLLLDIHITNLFISLTSV